MHKWKNENQERITDQIFIKENRNSYKWIEKFDTKDKINKVYLTKFELDKDCFQKMINNYKIRQSF